MQQRWSTQHYKMMLISIHMCLSNATHQVQVQAKQSKDWAIHVEAFDVGDKVYRISLSNIYKAGKVRIFHVQMSCMRSQQPLHLRLHDVIPAIHLVESCFGTDALIGLPHN